MEKHNNISNENPFKVPENYFDEVKKRIILSTSENKPEIRKVDFSAKPKPWLRIAASVAILCVLGITGILYFSVHEKKNGLSALNSEELPAMFLDEIDISSIEETVILEGVPLMGYQVEAKDIVDYLLSDNIDITEIEEHF
jgi:hypothetical protein